MVCQSYAPPNGYIPNMSNPLLDHHYGEWLQGVFTTSIREAITAIFSSKQLLPFGFAES